MLALDQPSMYFIPGWGFNSQIFKCSALSEHPCDLLDYSHLDNLSMNIIVEHLAGLIANDSIVVAWSLGGLFAIQIAYLFPNKIRKLILIASQPRFLEENLWKGIPERDFVDFIQRTHDDYDTLMTYFLSLVNYPNRSSAYKNSLKNNVLNPNKHQLNDLLRMMLHIDLRQEYKEINKPILHIIGQKDCVISQNPYCFSQLNKNVQIEIVDQAGHAGFITHGKKYLKIANEFFEQKSCQTQWSKYDK